MTPAELDGPREKSVVIRGRARTRAKRNAKRPQISVGMSIPASTNSFEAAAAIAKETKAEESSFEQIIWT